MSIKDSKAEAPWHRMGDTDDDLRFAAGLLVVVLLWIYQSLDVEDAPTSSNPQLTGIPLCTLKWISHSPSQQAVSR